ncbi:C4-dicarboxylate ABC transporter permease [Prauserella marina]|uniref:TRAP transporter, DctM subunit n=1 Tax=Prauserella marina TaxID=530584 RepID=A0A222VNN1_9PSEU|nr:TRAP transporter large permease [Prauserella marina]ASR35517.1 C4-dicarboxylate ABC transporter permease [Prauserella marina]PWV84652.1 tripartite ATP-independent transporter DctM subunit [Prauserella marina]SDC16629.1 TRAP transporter, DctM subunit [Prauserella marina]
MTRTVDPVAAKKPGTVLDSAYWAVAALAAVTGLLLVVVPAWPAQLAGFAVVVIAILMLILGIHVGIAMMSAGALGMWNLAGADAVAVTFEDVAFSESASWSLSVVPLFVLMGVAMGRFNLTGKLFSAAEHWFGRVPGGLAVSTNLAGAGLAAASGSSIAISYALGRTTIPEMLRAGYKPSLATGVVAASGSLGMLIPPSVVLVIYSSVTQTPVGPQLLAALVPGILMAVGYTVMIMIRCALDPSLGPRSEREFGWRERFASLRNVVPVVLILLVIIGGMYSGLFTPTEAGAFGALAAIVLGWLFGGNRKARHFATTMLVSFRETASGVASIFLLLMGVHVLTRAVTLSGIADALTEGIVSLGLSRIGFLLLLVVAFLILGMFMDGLAIIFLTVPILMPVLESFDIDLMWFGVFIVILVELAMITPPIGVLSYIVHRISQNPDVNLGTEVRLSDVFKGIVWFVAVGAILLLALIFFPDLALWLPGNSSAQ